MASLIEDCKKQLLTARFFGNFLHTRYRLRAKAKSSAAEAVPGFFTLYVWGYCLEFSQNQTSLSAHMSKLFLGTYGRTTHYFGINWNIVFSRYTSPGRSRVEGNSGCRGEEG
jgi:hypothetical protein